MAMKRPSIATTTTKNLAVLQNVTHVAKDPQKRCYLSTFRVLAIFTRPQTLSENVTVRDSVLAVALFVTKLQALGSKIMVVQLAQHQQCLWTV
jgi:hypothetical protein